MPWDDSCANVLISEVAHGSFTTYGSTGTCNKSPYDTTSGYLIAGAGSGGASNCATGAGGTDQGDVRHIRSTVPGVAQTLLAVGDVADRG